MILLTEKRVRIFGGTKRSGILARERIVMQQGAKKVLRLSQRDLGNGGGGMA